VLAGILIAARVDVCAQAATSSVDPELLAHNFSKWDELRNEVVLYRDASAPGDSAVTVGAPPRLSVYPLRDFAGASAFKTWDVCLTTGGGVVVLGIVEFAPRQVEHVILTYDSEGKLRKHWNVAPYHHHSVAADAEGNVYAFGHLIHVKHTPSNPDYPLLVKYSPNGAVIWKTLSWHLISSSGEAVLAKESDTGSHGLLLVPDGVLVYAADATKLIYVSSSGQIRKVQDLAGVLTSLAKANAAERTEMLKFGLATDGSVIAQVRLYPRTAKGNILFQLVQINEKGKTLWTPLGKAQSELDFRFLGVRSDTHDMVFVKKPRNGKALLESSKVFPPS
jgi:hypothetical protein